MHRQGLQVRADRRGAALGHLAPGMVHDYVTQDSHTGCWVMLMISCPWCADHTGAEGLRGAEGGGACWGAGGPRTGDGVSSHVRTTPPTCTMTVWPSSCIPCLIPRIRRVLCDALAAQRLVGF